MILEKFQNWARTASASDRADGVRILAKSYLYSDLGRARPTALRLLTEFLDDPSPLVRTALAELVAGAGNAPHHLVLALADDQADIARLVLARSPVLSDAELIECAASVDERSQAAIAGRPSVSAALSAALAEVSGPAGLVALAGNRNAMISAISFGRMVERFGNEPELREALLLREDLPAPVRLELVAAATRALAAFVAERNWMSDDRMKRVATEARDKAAITVAASQPDSQADLVAHLRRSGQLTVGLAFRAILSGRLDLFQTILSELTGMHPLRIEGLIQGSDGTGFAALYRKAALPAELLPAFRVALDAVRNTAGAGRTALHPHAVEHVRTACEAANHGEFDKLLVLLRRFEAEAAREDARSRALPRLAPVAEPIRFVDAAQHHHQDVVRLPARRPAVRYEIDMVALESALLAA